MKETAKVPETKIVTIIMPAYYSSSEARVAKVTLSRGPWEAQPEVAV